MQAGAWGRTETGITGIERGGETVSAVKGGALAEKRAWLWQGYAQDWQDGVQGAAAQEVSKVTGGVAAGSADRGGGPAIRKRGRTASNASAAPLCAMKGAWRPVRALAILAATASSSSTAQREAFPRPRVPPAWVGELVSHQRPAPNAQPPPKQQGGPSRLSSSGVRG